MLNTKLIATESQQAMALVDYCNAHLIPIIHIANEGKRLWLLDARKGIQKGFPDFLIPLVKMPYGGLFLELKREKKSLVSQQQWDWIARLNKLSYIASIAYGLNEAIGFIDGYRKYPTNTWKWEKFLGTLHRIP